MIKNYDLPEDLVIKLKKEIPVAGGMAGGSADAAGCNCWLRFFI